jgi:hypothetical protein
MMDEFLCPLSCGPDAVSVQEAMPWLRRLPAAFSSWMSGFLSKAINKFVVVEVV